MSRRSPPAEAYSTYGLLLEHVETLVAEYVATRARLREERPRAAAIVASVDSEIARGVAASPGRERARGLARRYYVARLGAETIFGAGEVALTSAGAALADHVRNGGLDSERDAALATVATELRRGRAALGEAERARADYRRFAADRDGSRES